MPDWKGLHARDVMSTPVVTVPADLRLGPALRTLASHRISGAPVTSPADGPLGVISVTDVLLFATGLERELAVPSPFYLGPGGSLAAARASAERVEEWGLSSPRSPLNAAQVRDVMSAEVISVRPDTPLPDVAALMHERQVHRVIVLDGFRPVGVVTATDLIAALAADRPGWRQGAAASAAGRRP